MKKKTNYFVEIKEVTEAGEFEGILSPYGNVDQGGDVVEKGAFTKTLREGGPTRPLLWQHNADQPVGEIMLEDRDDGLWAKGKLLMELKLVTDHVYPLLKNRIVKSLSIGFQSIKDSIEGGVRHLKEIKLYEGSLVMFPMNELAQITRVKAMTEKKGDFNEELRVIQTFAAFNQTQVALESALRSLVWSDMERDEKITSAQTIIEQFSEAFMAFWPDYLDALVDMWGPMESWSKNDIERKAGAVISTANKTTIRSACEKILSGHNSILALAEDEAADDKGTSPDEAAAPQPSEPEIETHSAVQTLDEIRALIPA